LQFIIIGALAVVFTVVLAAGQTMFWAWQAKQEREQKEVIRRLNMQGDVGAMEESLFRDRARDGAAMALGQLGAHLQAQIEAADSTMLVSTLLVQMGIAAGVGILLGLLVLGIYGLIPGLLPGLLPYFLLRYQASQRSKKLLEQLPDALDLMARSLQAGLGLNEAFRTCAEEMPIPVAAEFGRVFEEVRLGREYREAFANMTRRNPGLFDLRLFVSSVLLQRETGGNLIEILDSISNTIRGRFLFHAKVQAMTSEARFSALILGGLPLAVAGLLLFMNPEYLSPLFTDPLGHLFLAYFAGSYGIGGYLMYWISQVEV
jgi:tight adherence protein B